ncbi:hypothetical protein Tco_1031257 [Tanacetum coccineum]|uniref:Uncharacterized protein n=1 Tax=Tanacetum coccineum TaxID=301880 RepID=A0ABQ5G8G3_9ASTR
MFNMNERVYNLQSQIQNVSHQVSMFHLQDSQVINPQPSMIHSQASLSSTINDSSTIISSDSSTIISNPLQVDSSLIAPYILLTDDQLECLAKALTFMSTILASSYPSSNNQLDISSNPMHQVAMPERQTLSYVGNCSTDTGERINFGPGPFIVTTNALFQANGVEVKPYFEQSSVVNHLETEINSDSNIIPYSRYVTESQQTAVHNSNSSAQQDALILSVIEQLEAKFERRPYVDFKSKDNVSDSCEQSVEIDRLKQTLSEHVKEKESLMQTVTLLKNDFKKEESRNIDREIALEKKIKHYL